MAFPAIVGSPVPTVGPSTASPVISLPPLAAGNLGLMWIRNGLGGTITVTGWTELVTTSADAATDDQTSILYRVADGSEGTTVTGSFGTAGKWASIVWEISGASHPSTQAPQLSTIALGTTGLSLAPQIVTPTGGAKDYLFGVLVAMDGEYAFSSYPANYTLGQANTDSGTSGLPATNVRVAGAWRQLNAASDTPGAVVYTSGSGAATGQSSYAIAIHPALVPTITDVETTELIVEGQTGVTITGTNFETAQGTGKVELANNATYASATIKVAQTVTSWASATSLDLTAVLGTLTPGTVYVFVTNRSGGINATGFAVTIQGLPTITNVETTNQIYQGQTNVTITGTNFLGSGGTVELASTATYATATKVTQTTTSWGATSIDFTVNLGGLSLGTLYVFVTNTNTLRNAAFAVTAVIPGASWLAALNTTTSVNVTSGNVQLRLRVGVTNSGGAGVVTAFKWQYRRNAGAGFGAWTDLTASSSYVKTFATTYYADGDDVPQLLTAGGYQADNNAAEESTGAFTLPAGLPASASVESEIALELIAADLTNSDVLEFRILQVDNTPLDTYTQTPTLTITKAGATPNIRDTATRLRLSIRAFRDVLTRVKLTVRNSRDTATRLRLTVQTIPDVATRFRLAVANAGVRDVASRLKLSIRTYKDTATRLKLGVQAYRDAASRVKLSVRTYRDAATRLRLNTAAVYRDVRARMVLQGGPGQLLVTFIAPTLDTDGNPLPGDLDGFLVYYGTAPGVYGAPIDIGHITTYLLTGLIHGTVYYVAIRSYDVFGNQSALSAESSRAADPLGTLYPHGGDVATRFRLSVTTPRDVFTRVTVAARQWVHVATRLTLQLRGYRDVATRLKLTGRGTKDTATRLILAGRAYKDTASRLRLSGQGVKDIATRVRLAVANAGSRDATTRLKLSVRAYKDTATRLRLGVQAYRDTASRLKLSVRGTRDTATRLRLLRRGYKDTASRLVLQGGPGQLLITFTAPTLDENGQPIPGDLDGFLVYYGTFPGVYGPPIDIGHITTYLLTGLIHGTTYYVAVKAYDVAGNQSAFSAEQSKAADPLGTLYVHGGDIATRLRLAISTPRDVFTRVRVVARQWVHVATRVRVSVRQYANVATRVRLAVANAGIRDAATRLKLSARTTRDTFTRLQVGIRAYRDAATRLKLHGRGYRDAATRLKLIGRVFANVASRVVLNVRAYRDTATRLRLLRRGYRDAATRFKLQLLQTPGWRDVQARFVLALPQLAPSLVFASLAQPTAMVSTVNLLTWAAVSTPTGLESEERLFLFAATSQGTALVSTLDLLTWASVSTPAALVSEGRGG